MGLANALVICVLIPIFWLVAVITVFALIESGVVEKKIYPELLKLGFDQEKIPHLSVVISFLFAWLSFYPALFWKALRVKGLDNQHPREDRATVGTEGRLWSAHTNANETFLYYAVAVLLALQANVPVNTILPFCLLHLCMRVLFHVFYFLNAAPLRSLSWVLGTVCTIAIYTAAICPDMLRMVQGLVLHGAAHVQGFAGSAGAAEALGAKQDL